MIPFLAHFLVVLAGWTLTIKFLFPFGMALAEGVPLLTYVYWDFWWVAHLALAWSLLNWNRYTLALAIGVAVVEIAIVTVKFFFFLQAPDWTIWTTNWFINKVFVLIVFWLLLGYLAVNWQRVTARPREGAPLAPSPATGD